MAITRTGLGYFFCTQIHKARVKQRGNLDIDVERLSREGCVCAKLGTGSVGHTVECLHSCFFHSPVTAEAVRHVYNAALKAISQRGNTLQSSRQVSENSQLFTKGTSSRDQSRHSTSESEQEPILTPENKKVIGPKKLEREPYGTRWETVLCP